MIMEPFNLTHVLTITILPVVLFLAVNLILKKKSESAKRNILLLICLLNIILYIIYKIVYALNPDNEFDILLNLPLHVCNINLILLPLAVLLKNKALMAYQLYFGTVLAALALLTIDADFMSKPLFEFTCFIYFYYHSMLVILPFMLVKHKFFRPSFKNVWQPTVILIALTIMAHIINVIFRATGIAPEANYFFTYGLRGSFFTELYWKIIPYNFFYLLPSLLSFAPYIILITLPFYLSDRKQRKLQKLSE